MKHRIAALLVLAVVLSLPLPEAAARVAPPSSPAVEVARLVLDLKDRKVAVRRSAAYLLGKRGRAARAAAPALANALKDADREVQLRAALALGRIGEPALPALAGALKDQDRDARRGAVAALRHFGPKAKAVVPLLIEALKDNDAQVRTWAALTLAPMGELAVPALVGAFKDGDTETCLWAGMALSRIGEQAVPALTAAVKDRDSVSARRGATRALGLFGPGAKAAVPALVGALGDSDPEVRTNAALALKRIDPEAARRAGVR
jgi:HEAT repeat protein